MSTEEPIASRDSMITAGNVDLTNCDREQVQYPGAIQPHGVLLALREPELTLIQVSANTSGLLGVAAEDLLGQPLSRLLGEAQVAALRQGLAGAALEGPPERLMRVRGPDGAGKTGRGFEAYAHRQEGLLILELEERIGGATATPAALYGEVRRCVARLRTAVSMDDFFGVLAREVRSLTGFDQVHVYQFMEDLSGLVRAEARDDGQTHYLGLRFPATDVPEPARRLLSRLWLRHLPDVAYEPVPLIPELNPVTGAPLDLSFAMLRSTSPLCNRFYLNMGVRATLVLTLLKDGELWGFIGCHHPGPKTVPPEARAACESLAHMVSLLIAAKEEAGQASEALAAKAASERLIEAMAREDIYHLGLVRSNAALLDCVQAQGAVILVGEGATLLGETPDEAEVTELTHWLDAQPALFSTDRLPELYPAAEAIKDVAAGLLAIRLPEDSGYLMWLRPEQVQQVRWAGDPVKPVEIDARNGSAHLGPRRSFGVWEEEVHGRSRPWQAYQLEAAGSLRQAMIALHRAERLALLNRSLMQSNRDLAQGNEELESFAYTAAHDLKEPLRGIDWYAKQLQEELAGSLAEAERERLEGIERLTRRMKGLIDALLDYSRLSRVERAPCAVDLGRLVCEALDSLRARIESTGAEILVQPGLPVVDGDPVQLHEVLVNLISNALKYNDRDHKRVEIGMREGEEPLFFVKDNGIGIAPKHQTAVFGIFRRLHGRDRYGGGLGAGLAIVKKIIERQGGRIWVESTPGEGATFVFSLPGAPRGPVCDGSEAV